MTDTPNDPFRDRLRETHASLTEIRRDIHTHPEMGLEETRTAALVAGRLRDWGIEVAEGVGKTGVVGTLRGRRPGQRAIGLRADMDALSIPEQTGLPYASRTAGTMHACGHDGHTTMLLGAAQALAENPDFGGTVHFIFQPAEEGRGGAKAMLADGLFDRFPCDTVYGMHNMPGVPVGKFEIRKGPMLAAASRWVATFHGNGGHGGAAPHKAADLAVVQAHFVLDLGTIVARNISPIETAVISVGAISGGSMASTNVMPAEMTVGGTARCYSTDVQALIDRRMRELAEGIAKLHGATATFEMQWATSPLINHAEQVDVAVAAASAVVGADAVNANADPVTGGEDFADMLLARPGSFIMIGAGAGPDGKVHNVHTPTYDFNDAIIPIGAEYWVRLVQQELCSG